MKEKGSKRGRVRAKIGQRKGVKSLVESNEHYDVLYFQLKI
jgi:hypothetical protein